MEYNSVHLKQGIQDGGVTKDFFTTKVNEVEKIYLNTKQFVCVSFNGGKIIEVPIENIAGLERKE